MKSSRSGTYFCRVNAFAIYAALAFFLGGTPGLVASEPETALFRWRPVRLGAGGFVTGFVTHPLDASIRYCRTDVGNAYRWDGKEWRPLVVRSGSTGMPADLAATPMSCGVDSIAIDPADKRVVYLAMTSGVPDMLKSPRTHLGGNVFKSADLGANFTAGNLSVAMEPNGPWRTLGERLKVDPHNGNIVFYGSLKDGLWRSQDGGKTWEASRGRGGPAETANVLAVHIPARSPIITRGNQKCSSTVFGVSPMGSVYASSDGGVNSKNITAGAQLDGKCKFSTLDSKGILYVVADGSREVWAWRNGKWQKTLVQLDWEKTPNGIAFDPRDPRRVVAISDGGGLSRSLDGGGTWAMLGPSMTFENTLGWLPQKVGYRANAGVTIDRDGVCWIAQGNEGMVKFPFSQTEGRKPRAGVMIDSVGIEEFVTHDVILPPKGGAVFAVEDATGLVTSNLDQFVARQIPLQDQLISNGTGLAYCPNAPEFLAVVTADVHHTGSGKNYSGFSVDAGKTWTPFAGLPVDPSTGKPISAAGSIAISRRGAWKVGNDHLVWLPTGEHSTYYSHDGGRSWKPSVGFPVKNGYWIFALKQRLLAADPFTPDKFYLVGSWGGGFYVSTDGGKSWRKDDRAGLPQFNHHAQLAVNHSVKDDLWFCDGWDGASSHGLWHRAIGGRSFKKIEGIEYAITVCVGAGSGRPGDARYSVYFYGKMTASPDWGVFQSVSAGSSWKRISYYPAGLFDQPTCMAASWDKYAQVVIGFNGNSFVVGTVDK